MLYLPVGNYATTPYYLEELGVSLHTIEELCYYLRENAASLDEGIMRPGLCSFVEKELGLKELGRSLMDVIAGKGSLASFVKLIFEESGYVSRKELRTIEAMLRENEAVGMAGRRKNSGDYHLFAGRYIPAQREYMMALKGCDPQRDPGLYSMCMHNLGCAQAGLFMYEDAAKSFKKAWDYGGNKESYSCYLAALRMGNCRETYAALVRELGLDRNMVKALEDSISEYSVMSKQTEDHSVLKEALEDLETENYGDFDRRIRAVLSTWKNDYRRNAE